MFAHPRLGRRNSESQRAHKNIQKSKYQRQEHQTDWRRVPRIIRWQGKRFHCWNDDRLDFGQGRRPGHQPWTSEKYQAQNRVQIDFPDLLFKDHSIFRLFVHYSVPSPDQKVPREQTEAAVLPSILDLKNLHNIFQEAKQGHLLLPEKVQKGDWHLSSKFEDINFDGSWVK